MPDRLFDLLPQRRGHFRMESGYHSGVWYELDRLLEDTDRLRPFIKQLASRLARYGLDAICGPKSGGAKLAEIIASELAVKCFFTERFEAPEGTPGLFPVTYRVPDGQRTQVKNISVAIVDDAISAGSAVRGTHADLLACGARPVAFGALFVLGDVAAEFAAQNGLPLEALERVTYGLWQPEQCPLCQRSLPFEHVANPTPETKLP